MYAVDGKSLLFELSHLIFHQRDERAYHERRATTRDTRQLVAKRLAGSSRHNQQSIFHLYHCPTDRLLVWPERGKAKGLAQEA